jgi:hypothetical protein
MDGLFCSLSIFVFLTLRLEKQFVQKKMDTDFTRRARARRGRRINTD